MAKSITTKKTVDTTQQQDQKKQLTPRQIVKRHMKIKDDVITEEDIRNVKIDASVPKDKAHQPLPVPKGKKRPKDEDKDPKINTPWDVISE